MPGLMEYENGDRLVLRAEVVDARDRGGIIINLGGAIISVNQVNLDRADVRPASARPLTLEEQDRAEMAREAVQA